MYPVSIHCLVYKFNLNIFPCLWLSCFVQTTLQIYYILSLLTLDFVLKVHYVVSSLTDFLLICGGPCHLSSLK